MDFKFDQKGQWQYKKVEEIDYPFTVKDHTDEVQPLSQFEANQGKETLGVILSPDGNNKEAVNELRLKSETWRDNIQAGHIERHEAWQAISTTIMKTLQYPLPALTLTEDECKHIMAPVLESGLPKSAICRNYPRAVLYGPKEEGGMGLWNLYDFQGLQRISYLQEHLSATTMLRELLRTSIEIAKVEIGIGRNIFNLDYKLYQILLTNCWIKDTWKYASENQISIYDYTTKNMEPQRRNDLYLMEIIANEGFTKGQLQKINRCRLYLQVTTLSDIVDGYGELFTCSFNCTQDTTMDCKYRFPKQTRPDKTSIAMWKKALRKSFPRTNKKLDYKLGNWISEKVENHKWLYHPPSATLYQRYRQQWKVWTRNFTNGTLGKRPKFHYRSNGIRIPTDCYVATVKSTTNHNIVQITG